MSCCCCRSCEVEKISKKFKNLVKEGAADEMVIAELITRATDITFHDTTLPQDSVDYININRAVLTQRLKNSKQ